MKPTTILYIVLALIIGFGAGYLVFKGAPPAGVSLGEEPAPLTKSKWDSGAVSAWQALVSGKLTARDESSFVLGSESNSIALPLAPGTVFNDSRDFTKAVDFASVPLGATIRGYVNIDRAKGTFGSGNYTVQFE